MPKMYREVPDMCPGGYRVAIRAFSCTERKGCLPAVGPFVFHLREQWGDFTFPAPEVAGLSLDGPTECALLYGLRNTASGRFHRFDTVQTLLSEVTCSSVMQVEI